VKREIELKIFVEELGEIKKKLRKIGAKYEGVFREHDFFFDTPQEILKKKKALLRLRIGDTRHFLTYKENLKSGQFKSADEYEVVVKNPQELKKILEKIGFRVWFNYLKPRREYWSYRGNHLTLDSFPFGKFVEIEGSPKFIRGLAQKLNLDFTRSSAKSYIKLLRDYRKYKRLKI